MEQSISKLAKDSASLLRLAIKNDETILKEIISSPSFLPVTLLGCTDEEVRKSVATLCENSCNNSPR